MIERGLSQPQWDGTPPGDKTILLDAEQGFGDTFQFIRYAKLLKKQYPAATVMLECQPVWTKVLAACPGIDQLVRGGDDPPRFDVHCPLLSLPGIFQTTTESVPAEVPYLFADPALVSYRRERLWPIKGFRIGANWRGRAGMRESRRRDIPLVLFDALTQLSHVRLISLQKEDGGQVGAAHAAIVDLGEIDTEHGPFMDTAAIMMNLDLVITSDTSIVHLAGALGVPVWVALQMVQDWHWLLDRSDSPWYPRMRLFRQKQLGDWAGVFEEIEAALWQVSRES
jgi:hypothetical protein